MFQINEQNFEYFDLYGQKCSGYHDTASLKYKIHPNRDDLNEVCKLGSRAGAFCLSEITYTRTLLWINGNQGMSSKSNNEQHTYS